jgi:hypothetical protein
MLKLNAGTLCALAGRLILLALCSLIFSSGSESRLREEGKAGDMAAVQVAVDRCPDGGTVHVPAGDYGREPLHLRCNVTLYVQAGAAIRISAAGEDNEQANPFLLVTDTERVRPGTDPNLIPDVPTITDSRQGVNCTRDGFGS